MFGVCMAVTVPCSSCVPSAWLPLLSRAGGALTHRRRHVASSSVRGARAASAACAVFPCRRGDHSLWCSSTRVASSSERGAESLSRVPPYISLSPPTYSPQPKICVGVLLSVTVSHFSPVASEQCSCNLKRKPGNRLRGCLSLCVALRAVNVAPSESLPHFAWLTRQLDPSCLLFCVSRELAWLSAPRPIFRGSPTQDGSALP